MKTGKRSRKKKAKNSIAKPEVPGAKGGSIHTERPAKAKIVFSFKHLDNNAFNYDKKTWKYYCYLLNRLYELSGIYVDDFVGSHNHNKYYRNHSINWDNATKDGFGLEEQYEGCLEYQFSSGYQEGRVHGFITDNIFNIVWLDPKHGLCPTK